MSVGVIQRGVLYIKDIQEMGLFAVMVDSRLFIAFSATPLYYLMLPLIGILMTMLAIINGYKLVQSSNRNFDKWSEFLVSVVCAACASVALYGGVIATYLGVTFAAGPWFFFSGVVCAFFHQTVMLGLNLYRAYNSPKDSSQRMHHLQACLNNLFLMALLTSVIGCAVFVLLFPIAPVVASICAVTAVCLTLLNVIWRLLPNSYKNAIKSEFNINKFDLLEGHILTDYDCSAIVQSLNVEHGREYLSSLILARLNEDNGRVEQHYDVLSELSNNIETGKLIDKEGLVLKYPSAFCTFWNEKQDVEYIVDAAVLLHNKISNGC